jgi:hypothetical protein
VESGAELVTRPTTAVAGHHPNLDVDRPPAASFEPHGAAVGDLVRRARGANTWPAAGELAAI